MLTAVSNHALQLRRNAASLRRVAWFALLGAVVYTMSDPVALNTRHICVCNT